MVHPFATRFDAADWKDETKTIVAAILDTAVGSSTFSANDVRDSLPEDVNAHRVGRAFKLAQDRGLSRRQFVRAHQPCDCCSHRRLHEDQIGNRDAVVWVDVASERGQRAVRHPDRDRRHVLEGVRHRQQQGVHGNPPPRTILDGGR